MYGIAAPAWLNLSTPPLVRVAFAGQRFPFSGESRSAHVRVVGLRVGEKGGWLVRSLRAGLFACLVARQCRPSSASISCMGCARACQRSWRCPTGLHTTRQPIGPPTAAAGFCVMWHGSGRFSVLKVIVRRGHRVLPGISSFVAPRARAFVFLGRCLCARAGWYANASALHLRNSSPTLWRSWHADGHAA